MAGMTSQPSMGAIVACTKGTKLDTGESQTQADAFKRSASAEKKLFKGSGVSLMERYSSSITSRLSESAALQRERGPKKINPPLDK